MEVGKAGPGGCLELIFGIIIIIFFGAIRNACVLLAELCAACTVSVGSDTLGALQCLPWSLIASDK